uniref:C-type lectin domain-containing protein n=1 Tax=Panagrellus redivivus TaxID=6233 RepID=A0A7E4UPZ8_PANRE
MRFKNVCMDGHMNLPAENVEEFFNILICYRIKRVYIHTDNYKSSWLHTAEKTCKDAGMIVKSFIDDERFYPEIDVTNGTEKIRITGHCFNDDVDYYDSDDGEIDEVYCKSKEDDEGDDIVC